MIQLIAATIGGAIIGFFICAFFTQGSISELRSRIDHALAQETAGANATVKRICAILRGDA